MAVAPVVVIVATVPRGSAAKEETVKTLLSRSMAIAGIAIALDQLTKAFVRGALDLCTARGAVGCARVRVAGSFELIRIRNSGSAFGFHKDLWMWGPVAIAGLALVLVYARGGRGTGIVAIAAGLQVGGALGNLADRLLLGGVTDFIYLGSGPVFNVADVLLALGTLMATWGLWRRPDGAVHLSQAEIPQVRSTLAGNRREVLT
jgi:signal peptidase II